MSALSVTERQSPAEESSARPSLRALPRVRGRSRGLIASVLGLLLAALGAVLAVNIHVANTQYDVVQMQNQHEQLVHENETLSQQVQVLESPQSLSNSASTLGMVMPSSAGTFDLESSELLADASAASSDDHPSNFVEAAADPEGDATAPMDVAEETEGASGGLLGSGALHTLSSAEVGENETGETETSEPSGDRGGGTIPAPSLD